MIFLQSMLLLRAHEPPSPKRRTLVGVLGEPVPVLCSRGGVVGVVVLG